MTRRLRLLLLVPSLWLAGPALAAPRVTVAPASAWVEPVPLPDGPAPTAEDAGGDVAFLLVDDQVRRGPAGLEHYQRMTRQVLATSGIDDASELRVDFDPDYQTVVLHDVVIRRGAERRRALRPAEIKIVQREPDLDRRIYDGRLTAVVFLRDVRVGDVIDATWTIRGQNPVYGGRAALGFDLGWGVPVARLSVRVLWPEGRPLAVRVHGEAPAPTRTARAGEVEYRLERAPAPAVPEESDLPEGVDPFPWLELSEWSSWDEVVRWALPLYAPGRGGPLMEAKLAEWRALPDEAQRVRAALRFVQDEVRYLGIELGAGSHRPTPPAEVLQRRFGDCKDKSLLLVALLRGLGVEAAPALVNTTEHASIARRLPSPKAFDHVVVRARVGGVERWLEPTRSLERGPLEQVVPPGYRRALVLADGQAGLAELPEPPPSLVEVTSTWRVARWADPVAFDVVTRYEGLQAVGMRHELADTPSARLQKRYLEHYAREEPAVEVAAPIQVEDAPDADRLTITEHYRLPAAKEGARRDFVAEAIQERLVLPKTARRTLPLRVAHPALVRERLQLELPEPPAINPDTRVVDAAAMQLTRKGRVEGKRYVVDLEYRTLRTSVEPGAVAGHLAKVRDMQEVVSFSLPLAVVKPEPGRSPTRAAAERRDATRWMIYLAAFVGVLAVKGAVTLARRWRRPPAAEDAGRTQAFFRGLTEPPGASPQAPIAVPSLEALAARDLGLRCRCGAPAIPDPATAEAILLGGRRLQAVRAPCGRCGEVRRVYVQVG